MKNKQINLIPSDMAVPAKTLRLATLLNKISTVLTTILILVVLVMIAGIVYYNIEYRKASASVDSLKQKISALEKNEQKLVLAKDKLTKIQTLRKIDSVDDELIAFQSFETQILNASGSALTEISIDPDKTEVTLTSKSSSSLTTIMDTLSILSKESLKIYKRVVLSSLGYNINSGFLVSLIFEK